MSGKIVGRLLAAAVVSTLCSCTSISLDEPAPVVDSVPAISTSAARPVAERAPEQSTQSIQPLEENPNVIVESVGMPTTGDANDATADSQPAPSAVTPVAATGAAKVSVALLLPRRSDSLAQVSDAVRDGFMAAYQYEPGNITVNVFETSDVPQDVLSGYQDAASRNDIVVGPLTRSGTATIVQQRAVTRPTIALTQLNSADDATLATPDNMLMMGLSLEDEAHQVADWASRRPVTKAFAISTSVSWQRRAADAFATQWRSRGLQAETMQLTMSGNYLNASALSQLQARLQSEKPDLIFIALDAGQARQLRSAIGDDVDIYGTSQLNPLTLTDWDSAEPLTELDGVRLVDMPWQLQADHAAVMAYPRQPSLPGPRRSPDVERLYALGIDAYRVARNIAAGQNNFELDGVTGKLTVRFGSGATSFERVEQPAAYIHGKVKPLESQ